MTRWHVGGPHIMETPTTQTNQQARWTGPAKLEKKKDRKKEGKKERKKEGKKERKKERKKEYLLI